MMQDYAKLTTELRRSISSERVASDPFRTVAWGADASFYRMQPKIVVTVESEDEVKTLLASCHRHNAPVTFRAAGTSLSGQAVTDSVLARLGDGWNQIDVVDGGAQVVLGPGVIGSHANAALKSYGRKLGPDPASINACMIGGIAANNASGMCCGTAQNSYRTVRSVRVVLADGTVLDSGDLQSVEAFKDRRKDVVDGLAEIRQAILANPVLADRIRRKYAIKNTTGYSLNAFVDFEDPIDILVHLMIGSEGTLGFISKICYDAVPDPTYKAATLAFYETPRAAADVVTALMQAPVAAIELIDRAGIRSAEGKPNMPEFLSELGPQATALLIEVQSESASTLEESVLATRKIIDGFDVLYPIEFSSDPNVCAGYWAVRKGLFPAVGALRETGTTVIIEDVAFPVENLGRGVTDLQDLFNRHGYDDAILFGHARDGNLHVVFSQDFRHPSEIERYARFMDELCDLVVNRYDGSLKAEHGTGRNVAPYVELEWGRDALALMRRIKDLFDPEGILNPGVIITDDPQAHLKNLKDLPAAHPVVDKCTECGFCESHCPSNLLTTSPRQRVVAYRYIQNASDGSEDTHQVTKNFGYQVLDTCAACGLCATVCPVKIDTGSMVKDLRGEQQPAGGNSWAAWVANHFGTVTDAAGLGLRAGALAKALFGATTTEAMSGAAKVLSGGNIPKWSPSVPDGYRFHAPTPKEEASTDRPTYVYLPSCVSRTMRPVAERGYHEPLPMVVERLAERAGVRLVYPESLKDLCCGQPFESKGMSELGETKAKELLDAVKAAGGGESVRLLSDTSPCSYRLRVANSAGVEVVDLVEFLHDAVIPKLELSPVRKKLAVHATCSIRKLGLSNKLRQVAAACAPEVVAPSDVECCGFAGDRGFTTPELNAHALRNLRGSIDGADAGCSSSVTCEIGLAKHSGVPYRSVAYFVDEAARHGHAPEVPAGV